MFYDVSYCSVILWLWVELFRLNMSEYAMTAENNTRKSDIVAVNGGIDNSGRAVT